MVNCVTIIHYMYQVRMWHTSTAVGLLFTRTNPSQNSMLYHIRKLFLSLTASNNLYQKIKKWWRLLR